MTDLEKRRTRRYELTAPVNYWWPGPGGSVQASRGMTLDISNSGVMIIAGKSPPMGVRIQATIYIARQNGGTGSLELHGEGIVARIEPSTATEPSERSKGFAATMHFYSELSNESNSPDQEISEP